MAKASMKTRNEVIENHRAKYKKSTKKGKGEILDAVCLATGLSRDRAQRLLAGKGNLHKKSSRSGRNPKYGQTVCNALADMWMLMDFAGGKRLCAGISDMLDALIRHEECEFDECIVKLLREISPATADRILKKRKERMRIKGISTTKPGTLLKKDIPLRMGTEWNENAPGFLEIDLVAHCGATTAGEYINTLDATDICTGWTETRAVINKAQLHVFNALKNIKDSIPFAMMGIDSDNGSEFINHHLHRYCKENSILFTRSRPYIKNDSCHVEQKNWHVVRRNIGYNRYEGKEALRIMNEYYALLRLYTNFFMPHMKLLSKTRNGAYVRKHYDIPTTPYKRLLQTNSADDAVKSELNKIYMSLNPVAIKRDMIRLLDKLSKLGLPC